MSQQEIQQLEISMEQAREAIDLKKSMEKLIDNADFKKLITEGYFEKEASRLVLMKADPTMQADEHQKAIMVSIDAVGHFRQYIRTIMQIGAMAENSLASDEETHSELLAEEA